MVELGLVCPLSVHCDQVGYQVMCVGHDIPVRQHYKVEPWESYVQASLKTRYHKLPTFKMLWVDKDVGHITSWDAALATEAIKFAVILNIE